MTSTCGCRRSLTPPSLLPANKSFRTCLIKQTPKRKRHSSFSLVLEGTEDIRVTSVGDGHGRDSEVLSASSAEVQAVTLIVVDGGLGEHGVILKLRLSQGRAVVGDEDQLGYNSVEMKTTYPFRCGRTSAQTCIRAGTFRFWQRAGACC